MRTQFSAQDSTGLAGFCQSVEKNVFFAEKTGVAKIVFVDKNSFLPPKFTCVVF